jgi:hypothetical protein
VLNPTYKQLAEKTEATSLEAAKRAVAGELTEDTKTKMLVHQAVMWMMFVDASEGVKIDNPDEYAASLYDRIYQPGASDE